MRRRTALTVVLFTVLLNCISVASLTLLYNNPFALSLSKGELLNYIEGFRSWFDMLTTNGL